MSDILKGRFSDDGFPGEVGCTTSHLKALKMFCKARGNHALIVEDDVDIDIARYWNFTWKEFYSKIPYDWDVVQLAITCTGNLYVKLHRRFVNDFSTAAYLITRHHAQKLVRHHVRGEKYKLDKDGKKPRAVADDLIYNTGVTYAIPLFLYRISLGSSIHPEHVDYFHKASHDGLKNFWMQMDAMLILQV